VMTRPFLIQGHRGACGIRPENTLPSFEFALDCGANSLECDVHLSADGDPILIHDSLLPDGSGPVHSKSTAELAAIGIPTLVELFRFVAEYARHDSSKTPLLRANAARAIIDVDMKTTPFCLPGGPRTEFIEQAVLAVIQESGAVERTWVRSFDHRVVRRMRQSEPRLTGVVLIEGTAPVDPASLVRAADAQVYGPDYRFLDEEQVRKCQSAGYRVQPWTVNDPENWKQLLAWEVGGITTDRPDRLVQWLNQPPASAR
jgi:glycerophosphoryl diester phosphodiesterase